MSSYAKLIAYGLIVLAVLSGAAARAETTTLSIQYDGRTRTALVYAPASVRPGAALVLALHGGAGNGARMRRLSGFDSLAERHGFVVAYPNASAGQWNDGRERSAYRRGEYAVDDVGFLAALIDRLIALRRIDPDRVFATGISNGGMMSLRLACALSGRFAAVAAVAANMPARMVPECAPEYALGVLVMNGTEDGWVPYEGGHVTVFLRRYGRVVSTDATIDLFRRANGCSDTPLATPRIDRYDDGTRVREIRWPACRPGGDVLLVSIEGGGHSWPGTGSRMSRLLFGRTSREIAASELIWRFFTRTRR